MPTTIITEEQWQKLKPILLDLNIYDKPSLKETFLGIIYRRKTGCPWRYLPNCYGKANTVFKAFRRWSASGLFFELDSKSSILFFALESLDFKSIALSLVSSSLWTAPGFSET